MGMRTRGGTHLEYAILLILLGLVGTCTSFAGQAQIRAMRRVHPEVFR